MSQDFEIQIPIYVQTVMTHLETAGFEAFVVGGCVRDSIMGKKPCDWDVCTSAKPNQIKKIFKGVMPVILTGEKHGTVTVVSDKNNVEVTTYRYDGVYKDNRHPEGVTFVSSVEDDLARRDFTVNAMAYNPKTGFVDMFGGSCDISNKTIRCVGDAKRRFEEDALRIMRALRFSAVLSFEIEKNTSNAIRKCKNLLENVSVERIYTELTKLLLSAEPSRILKKYRDVFEYILPSVFLLNNLSEKYLEIVDALPFDINLRLAAILMGLEVCDARRVLGELKTDKKTRDMVCDILSNINIDIPTDRVSVKYMLKRYGVILSMEILELIKAKQVVYGEYDGKCDIAIALLKDVVDSGECFSAKDLNICGMDLINLGVEPGPKVGNILDKLLSFVIEGDVENNNDALVEYAAKNVVRQ